eukprot:2376110-Heterocapsa_arctica.AAC.1
MRPALNSKDPRPDRTGNTISQKRREEAGSAQNVRKSQQPTWAGKGSSEDRVKSRERLTEQNGRDRFTEGS